jgi:hypothetical protein
MALWVLSKKNIQIVKDLQFGKGSTDRNNTGLLELPGE